MVGKFNTYKRVSKKRNKIFNITFEEFLSFWQKPCFYCGSEIETIGLDRIDNNKGYELENVVSCCKRCNTAKSNMTYKEFIELCKRIASIH
ncbi:MAG: hypothetical protein WC516_05295 [Patescibacteria group bacterium]|jgi:5-methylcytosine-specific restriction endonuclease McrA